MNTHAGFAPRSVRTVSRLVFRPLLLCRLAGVYRLLFLQLVGLVNVLLVLLGLQSALSLLFPCRLARGSFHLVVADRRLHVLFTLKLWLFFVFLT